MLRAQSSQASSVAPGAAGVPSILAKSGLPFVLPPSGTMSNNGAFTAGTALPRTIAQGFMWFAAAQIAAGSLAGWYYFTGQSTTAFTIFNNTYTGPGVPVPPASPTAFVTTGPGAITGVTTATTAQQISIPANTLGANGVLRSSALTSVNASANNKTQSFQLGGVGYAGVTFTTAAQFGNATQWDTFNQQSQAVQLTAASGNGLGVSPAANVATTANFANAVTWQIVLTNAVATDWQIVEAFMLEVIP